MSTDRAAICLAIVESHLSGKPWCRLGYLLRDASPADAFSALLFIEEWRALCFARHGAAEGAWDQVLQ